MAEHSPQGESLAQKLLRQQEEKQKGTTKQAEANVDPLALHKPKEGEVLYECLNAGQPVNSALSNGTPVRLPMYVIDKGVIAELDALAKHTGLIKITRG